MSFYRHKTTATRREKATVYEFLVVVVAATVVVVTSSVVVSTVGAEVVTEGARVPTAVLKVNPEQVSNAVNASA